ncbi:hypothetical protein FPI77_11600 [Klebsiella quasivariicola]|nr:hypothetical protein [Klebsiella quasivariicola]NBZ76157.1 hypothetical protein [Klebsiella quasivariicola]TTN50006.1 hypothetical protein FPI77_11600 [Klebsiella quasivariicola]
MVVITGREHVSPLQKRDGNGVPKDQLSGLFETLFHTIPRPNNIDARRANRLVVIKMPIIMRPQ